MATDDPMDILTALLDFEASDSSLSGNQETSQEKTEESSSPLELPKKIRQGFNERERRRHHNVHSAFETLSNLLPAYPIHKKMKKREILKRSIKYITILRNLLDTMESISQPCLSGADQNLITVAESDTNPIFLIDDKSDLHLSNTHITQTVTQDKADQDDWGQFFLDDNDLQFHF